MGRPPKNVMAMWGSLYGDTPLQSRGKKKSCNTRKRRKPEEEEQIKLATWLTMQGILFYAVPNGGYRHKLEAFNLKRSGLQPGVPDLCIPIASKGYHALYIELKAQGGIVSDNQQYWLVRLNAKGNLAKVCYGFEEAKKVVSDYLGI